MAVNRRARDDRGWRVPKEGTKSRAIYDLAVQGLGPKAMLMHIDGDVRTISVLLWRIRNPGPANAVSRTQIRGARAITKGEG